MRFACHSFPDVVKKVALPKLRASTCKAIQQLELATGEPIATFPSGTVASRQTGVSHPAI